jgi:hypothetical protein
MDDAQPFSIQTLHNDVCRILVGYHYSHFTETVLRYIGQLPNYTVRQKAHLELESFQVGLVFLKQDSRAYRSK